MGEVNMKEESTGGVKGEELERIKGNKVGNGSGEKKGTI